MTNLLPRRGDRGEPIKMPDNRFLPVLWKLDRAEALLFELRTAAHAMQRTAQFAALRTAPPRSTPDLVWLVGHRVPAPYRLSAVVGDLIHNLRAALDNLVWELCGCPNDWSPGMPICARRPKDGLTFHPMMTEMAKQLIDSIQPYARAGKNDPLWLLNRMWNRDKHRMGELVSVDVWTHCAEPLGDAGPSVMPDAGELVVRASARGGAGRKYRIVPAEPNHLTLVFAVRPTGKGRDLLTGVEELQRYVRDEVVALFQYEDCFPR